ncbi:MAG TPA: acetylxylan esterase [Kiritimatiellia bacterium]|nr:acetylxylan esterase [Kiritimatiellia bacterium]HPS09575.1 acetylxylan esterase [Kiritimatiellia bacterium]
MLRIRGLTFLAGLACFATGAFAGTLLLVGKTDKASALYEPGEKMVFSVRLEEDGRPVAGKKLVWQRTGDDQKSEKGEAVSGEQPLQIVTACDTPGFVRIVVTAQDEAGQPIQNDKKQTVVFDGGAGVRPEKLESVPAPADFDTYWASQKAELAKTPMKVLEMKPVPETVAGVAAFDIKVACAGGMPVSGYYCKPKDAAPKSAAAVVQFQGYSVVSAGRPDYVARDPKRPAIVLCINVHGIENGREPAYYQNLNATTLKSYAYNNAENARRETAFFNGMTLRLLRALEFIKAQPEWDGKKLTVTGGSQGGLQSLIAAGLDPAVTRCEAFKPWCCDLGGITLSRLRGWRPDYTAALDYFDPVNHAKRIRCETVLTAGLGDYVCPPSGVSVVYNHIRAPKTLDYIQGATHGYTPPKASKYTLSSK